MDILNCRENSGYTFIILVYNLKISNDIFSKFGKVVSFDDVIYVKKNNSINALWPNMLTQN